MNTPTPEFRRWGITRSDEPNTLLIFRSKKKAERVAIEMNRNKLGFVCKVHLFNIVVIKPDIYNP